MTKKSLVGKKFGKWTVIGKSRHPIRKENLWITRCKCGTVRLYMPTYNLVNGKTLSCGAVGCRVRRWWKKPKNVS